MSSDTTNLSTASATHKYSPALSLPAGNSGKIKLAAVVTLAIIFLIGFGLVYTAANGTLEDLFTGGLTTTPYSFEGVHYSLKYFTGSQQVSANSVSALTQGGTKPISDPALVLLSPVLGSYGTGVDMFIVPAVPKPVLPNNKCSDKTHLYTVFQVPMAASSQSAAVCSISAPGQIQTEYFFQFQQSGKYYDGFVQLAYNWSQVTKSKQSAAAFEKSASLAQYNDKIKTIIGSIKVQ